MKAEIEALMKEHGLWGWYFNGAGDSSVTEKKGAYVLTFGVMPQLSFFVALSGLCRVPIDSIKIETDEGYCGCETWIEYTVTVPRNIEIKPVRRQAVRVTGSADNEPSQ